MLTCLRLSASRFGPFSDALSLQSEPDGLGDAATTKKGGKASQWDRSTCCISRKKSFKLTPALAAFIVHFRLGLSQTCSSLLQPPPEHPHTVPYAAAPKTVAVCDATVFEAVKRRIRAACCTTQCSAFKSRMPMLRTSGATGRDNPRQRALRLSLQG